jgi:hypothetical protein
MLDCLGLGASSTDIAEPFEPTDDNYEVAQQNTRYARRHPLETPVTEEFSCPELAKALRRAEPASGSRPRPAVPAFSFSEMDSAGAARFFARRNGRDPIAVMNFANGVNPGGGYTHGSRAQEEALCRQWPMYHPALREDFYPFGAYCRGIVEAAQKGNVEASNNYKKVLVTPGVRLMRDGPKEQFRALEPDEMLTTTMVAATAPQAFWWRGGRVPTGGLEDTIVHTILGPLVAWKQGRGLPAGAEPSSGVLILGAWGCGAFGNDPRNMANLFIKALDTVFFSGQYDKLLAWLASGAENEASPMRAFYREVHFAVPAFRQADEDNVKSFRRGLEEFVSAKNLGQLETYGPLT